MTETEQKMADPVRKITLGFLAGWAWAIFAGVGSLGILFSGNVIAGFAMLLSALIALPPFGVLLRQRANIALSGVVKVVLIIVLISFGGSQIENKNTGHAIEGAAHQQQAATETIDLPTNQIEFGNANADAKKAYDEMDNDLKKSVVRKQRDREAMAATRGGTFRGWIGTLSKMTTNGDGDAVIEIQLDGCPCELKTWNNSLSDIGSETLIKNGSPLFNKILNMQPGNRVRISGTILSESSLSEAGSIDDPEWITRFSEVSPY